jgi:large subunit ribosomal protein L9
MKVILKEAIDHLGIVGAIVNVSDGYARNFLFPRKVAVPATENRIRQFEHEQRVFAAKVIRCRRLHDR